MFEIETTSKPNKCMFCLTTFYHGNLYMVYCVIQVCISLGLLVTLIYDQCTEKTLRYSVILYIESAVLIFQALDIILRLILLRSAFWKKWYFIMDFIVFCSIFICYIMVLANSVVVMVEDIDLVILILRFIFNMVFISILIQRAGKNKKSQKASIINLELDGHGTKEVEMNQFDKSMDTSFRSERTMSENSVANVTIAVDVPVQ